MARRRAIGAPACLMRATNVLGMTHGLKMLWSNARANATQMIKTEPYWNRPNQRFVDNSMSLPKAAVIVNAKTVSVSIFACRPDPALVVQSNLQFESLAE